VKTLILLRHGKSNWDTDFEQDLDRPVATRGRRAARQVGRYLRFAGLAPGLVLVSPALRAQTTATLTCNAGGFACPVEVSPAIYYGPEAAILEEIRQQVDAVDRVLVVGHEPLLSGLTESLTGARVRLPTASLVGIESAASSWSELAAGGGWLRFLLPPRLLP
jgi:phosphohistidine phosphatase